MRTADVSLAYQRHRREICLIGHCRKADEQTDRQAGRQKHKTEPDQQCRQFWPHIFGEGPKRRSGKEPEASKTDHATGQTE